MFHWDAGSHSAFRPRLRAAFTALGFLSVMLATSPAAAQDVYVSDPDDGYPAASCQFSEVVLCYAATEEMTAGVAIDLETCNGATAGEPITIEFAKFAMHSGLARIRHGDDAFLRSALGTATGADYVMSVDDMAYIVSSERLGTDSVVLLATRSVEDTEFGVAPVTRVWAGTCDPDGVIWSAEWVENGDE